MTQNPQLKIELTSKIVVKEASSAEIVQTNTTEWADKSLRAGSDPGLNVWRSGTGEGRSGE
jgi:hypothetical protein